MNLGFILSVPRSGSTLLSALLSKADAIYCPPEPWLLLGLNSLGYSHAENPANANSLSIATAEFLNTKRLPLLADAARSIYSSVLHDSGKSVFIDKTPRYYHCLPLVEELMPEAKAIVLLRNPLDVAASYRTTWAVNLPWILSQRADCPELFDFVLGFRRLLNFADRYQVHIVRYEDLVSDPVGEMQKVFEYFGVDTPIRSGEIGDIDRRFATSALGDKKILGTNSVHSRSLGSYKETFNANEIKLLVDAIGERTFEQLGYNEEFHAAVESFSIDHDELISTELYDAAENLIRLRLENIANPRVLEHSSSEGSETPSETSPYSIEVASAPLSRALAEVSTYKQQLREAYARQNSLLGQLSAAQSELDKVEDHLRESRQQVAVLSANLEGLNNRGGSARLLDLIAYSRSRAKRIVHNALWRLASGRTPSALPKITIVTPSYNCAEYIEETLQSVLNQSYPHLEYIVIDGGSTDGTREIIERYAGREDLEQQISYFISEPDDGMYHAIAKGFAKATGEILCYLNADDLLEGGGLTSVGRFFAQNPNVDVMYHEDVVLVSGWKYPNVRQPKRTGTAALLSGHILFQDGVFWRRSAYDRAGGMNADLRLAGDFDLWLRMSESAKFVRRPEHVSCFRMRPGQLSARRSEYDAEMSLAINKFKRGQTPLRLFAWSLEATTARLVGRLKARLMPPERLFFPIDFVNVPPPAVTIPPRTIEIPRSPIDGQPAERLLFSTPDTRFGDREISYVYLDARHGIAITHPKIEAERLDDLYKKYYSSPPTQIQPADGPSPYRQFNRKSLLDKIALRLPIDRFISKPGVWDDSTLIELKDILSRSGVDLGNELRFLDAGCFEGLLLDKISASTGWHAYGLEPNPRAVEVARSKGHRVWLGHAEEAVEAIAEDTTFDVIFMGQTIEHVDDPVRVIRRLRLLLSPGGVLVMSTPNLDSREIDWFGPTWSHWHTPYHRHLFSKRGLAALARQVGMKPVHIRSFSHPYWTAMSMTLNEQGLAGAVSHSVDFPGKTRRRALRAEVLKRVLYNRLGKGDYNYAVFRDIAK